MKTLNRPILFLFIAFSVGLFSLELCKVFAPVPVAQKDLFAFDFNVYRNAASDIASGGNPYLNKNYLWYMYPVFTAAVASVFNAVPREIAMKTWQAITHLCMVIGMLLMFFSIRPKEITANRSGVLTMGNRKIILPLFLPIVVLITSFFYPLFINLFSMNIQPILFLIMCLFFLMLHHNHDKAAGVLLAIGCLMKITPIVFLVSLLFTKRYKALGTWLAFMIAYGAFLLVTGWWRWELFFVKDIIPKAAYHGYSLGWSISFTVAFAQTFCPRILESHETFDLISKCFSLFVLVVTAGTLFVASRKHLFWRDAYVLGSFGMTLISPFLEPIHFVCLLPVIVIMVLDYFEGRKGHLYTLAYLLVFLGFMAIPRIAHVGTPHWCSFLVQPVIVLIVLWLMTAARIIYDSGTKYQTTSSVGPWEG